MLLFLPVRVLLGQPAWSVDAAQWPAVIGTSIAYLASALLLVAAWNRPRRPGMLLSLVVLVVLLSCFHLVLLLYPGIWYSRRLVLAGTVLAGALIVMPVLLPRRGLRVATALLLIVAFGAAVRLRPPAEASVAAAARTLLTSHGAVTATTYSARIPMPSRGGGIAAYDDGYILATADGDVYRLTWPGSTDSLAVSALPFHVPMNRAAFAADMPPEIDPEWFRVAHVLARPRGDSLELVVSHHYWHSLEQCFVMRISTLTLARDELEHGGPGERWQTLYDTRPCLRLKEHPRGVPFAGPHMGGRLADAGDGRLLVTSGDHQFDGLNSVDVVSQDTAGDYGKVLLVHPDGTADHLTMGHRNPQGLHVDASGRIWSTEHGPQGGDALHEIVAGANYGWPYFTLGTDYGSSIWPLQGHGSLDPADIRLPVYAWVPSVGVSNLIEVRRGPLAEWQGDLLVASLDGRTLFRIRRDGSRVIYVEPIEIGARIRDLTEGVDGRIVLWLDDGSILSLTELSDRGAAVFSRCVGCHSAEADATHGIGPNLNGVYGRAIGSAPGYDYSPALTQLSGRWTTANLDAFLADPQRFAPGTLMDAAPVTNAAERAAVIEYLEAIGGYP